MLHDFAFPVARQIFVRSAATIFVFSQF